MAEFLVVFVVTFLVVSGVALAMMLGRTPVYRPEPADIQSTLTRMLEGTLTENEWEFFINMPIHHDEQLDTIRQRCQRANEDFGLFPRAGKARIKEEGKIRLRHILNTLEQGGTRLF